LVTAFANPLVLRAAFVLLCAGSAFGLGLALIRLLRKNIHEEASLSSEAAPGIEGLPLHLYNTVIQQLKQQKHELQVQTQAEQRRARTTENFSQAVLSNLASGVLVFGTNGLVKQSNPAGKEILGFASLTGMSAEDVFRGLSTSVGLSLADEVRAVLREGGKRCQFETDYITPGGERRHIAVTVSPVPAADETFLGAACLISDLSEFDEIRRQQELHFEASAEMALALRTSLTTISGYAQQLANSRDPELARQLAADIANEAAHLDRTIGGFLAEKHVSKIRAAHAGAGNV
jgi:PAS domain S-box-containing protein